MIKKKQKKRNRKQDCSETLKKICVTDDRAALTRELKTVKEFISA